MAGFLLWTILLELFCLRLFKGSWTIGRIGWAGLGGWEGLGGWDEVVAVVWVFTIGCSSWNISLAWNCKASS